MSYDTVAVEGLLCYGQVVLSIIEMSSTPFSMNELRNAMLNEPIQVNPSMYYYYSDYNKMSTQA